MVLESEDITGLPKEHVIVALVSPGIGIVGCLDFPASRVTHIVSDVVRDSWWLTINVSMEPFRALVADKLNNE